MADPAPQAEPLPAPAKSERPIALMAVGVINALMAGPTLIALLVHAQLPPAYLALPHWYLTFGKFDAAVLLVSSVGLWLMRRWGFGLMVLAYFGSLIALVVARQPFACQAAIQFPLLALASLKWRALR